MNPDQVKAYLASQNIAYERVQISVLPEKLPWVENVDYVVIPNNPPVHDMPSRVRDSTGESFDSYPQPGSTFPPSLKTLSKTAFQDYCVSHLGSGPTGMGRFTEIMDATRDSANPAVRFAFERYEAADVFEKNNTATLTSIMAGDGHAGHLTNDERTAILDNWPTN